MRKTVLSNYETGAMADQVTDWVTDWVTKGYYLSPSFCIGDALDQNSLAITPFLTENHTREAGKTRRTAPRSKKKKKKERKKDKNVGLSPANCTARERRNSNSAPDVEGGS
jgi:hypothetical protein